MTNYSDIEITIHNICVRYHYRRPTRFDHERHLVYSKFMFGEQVLSYQVDSQTVQYRGRRQNLH